MKSFTSRPQTSEIALRLFARPLHPEFFDVLERYEYRSSQYSTSVSLTSVGHSVEFRRNRHTITEVLSGQFADLPRIKRLCSYSTGQPRSLRYNLDCGVVVQLCFECEYLAPDAYERVQDEHWQLAGKATLAQVSFDALSDAAPPLSFVNVDPLPNAIGIHAFHLFPGEHAIVKTQSLYRYVDRVDD
ncbi:MAG: DUF2617 family protein [Planctomycetaceae bacterium]|nr:DUF2617 family protein [Planctomycetaceae bacterium]